MANHESALKAHRQSLRRRDRNRSNRSALRTTIKKFNHALAEGTTTDSAVSISGLYAAVDKAVRNGILSKNAAARQKSRLTKRLNTASKAEA